MATPPPAQQTVTLLPQGEVGGPVITTPPQSMIAGASPAPTLSVEASGTSPLSYQWRFNGLIIPGATRSDLNTAGFQFTNAGVYTVTVSDGTTTVTSPGAIVDVPATLHLSTPPKA